mmetsp:Transcript_15590/g.35707  ORF Transcript_15590/g.35707 Transcript_15590/m.35707 type:complete len:203 (+) Transcript_15590:2717-3325(+)
MLLVLSSASAMSSSASLVASSPLTNDVLVKNPPLFLAGASLILSAIAIASSASAMTASSSERNPSFVAISDNSFKVSSFVFFGLPSSALSLLLPLAKSPKNPPPPPDDFFLVCLSPLASATGSAAFSARSNFLASLSAASFASLSFCFSSRSLFLCSRACFLSSLLCSFLCSRVVSSAEGAATAGNVEEGGSQLDSPVTELK